MPTSRTATRKASKKSGLTVKTFTGLNKKRMEKSSTNFGIRVSIKQGETVPVQFFTGIDEFAEYEQHVWNDGRWNFVPCAGDECPICQDEDPKKAKKSYCFAAVVYNLKDKKVQVLTGPKDLAGRVFYRYERKPGMFLKRTWDITKFPTTPVSYDVAVGEDDLVNLATKKKDMIDIDAFLQDELKSFYGADLPVGALASKEADDDDDDDEDDDDDDVYTLADLKKMKVAKLHTIAEDLEIEDQEDMDKSDLIDAIVAAGKEDDDEDDDEDSEDDDSDDEDDDEDDDSDDEDEDDDDEDEDEDDDPPPAKKKAATKKAAAKKKAPARRR